MLEVVKRKREEDKKLSLEDKINISTNTENAHVVVAAALGNKIKEEIEEAKEEIRKASEKISALEEMTAIQKELIYDEKSAKKRYSIKEYFLGMVKSALEIVQVKRKYSEIVKDISEPKEKNKLEEDRFHEKLERMLLNIYPQIPEARYSPSESINGDIFRNETSRLTSKIYDYLKENDEFTEKNILEAKAWAQDLALSLAHGRKKAIVMFVNNTQRNYPNTSIENHRVKRILAALEEKYGQSNEL